ncbi:hypothetical protein DIPPA_34492 [Diplonema papillatum]|nr:hypothetical protein DIPPA_34492 [Diplonema papillatum]
MRPRGALFARGRAIFDELADKEARLSVGRLQRPSTEREKVERAVAVADAGDAGRRPPPAPQGAYNQLIGSHPTTSTALAESIEVVKYGTQSETDPSNVDPETGRLRSARQMPHPHQLSMFNDPFKTARQQRAQGSAAAAPVPAKSDGLDPSADIHQHSSALAITYTNPYHIPDVLRGTDQCPGCGALLQCRQQFLPGYLSLEAIKLHIEEHDRMMKLRETYYSRQTKLHEEVQRSGWKEEYEYLDYMTQEEMESLHRYAPRPVTCERCQQLRSYTYDSKKMIMPFDEWKHELAEIKEHPPGRAPLVVLVVSLWDFESTFLSKWEIGTLTGGRQVLLVGTHADAMPVPWILGNRSAFHQRAAADPELKEKWTIRHYGLLGDWMKERAKAVGLKVVDALAVGNDEKYNVELVAAAVEHHRRGNDVYTVGAVNVGKSSLVANLYDLYCPAPPPHPAAELVTDVVRKGKSVSYQQRWVIPEGASAPSKALSLTVDNPFVRDLAFGSTVSSTPGTTIKNISFTLATEKRTASGVEREEARLVDTPGILKKGQVCNVLPFGLASTLAPKRRVHVEFFRLEPGYSILFGALARVDVLKGPAEGVVLKAVARWSRLKFRVVRTDEADIFYEKWKGIRHVLSPPTSPVMIKELGGLVQSETVFCEVNRAQPVDICINGVVFFTPDVELHQQREIVLRVNTVKGLVVAQRPAMLRMEKVRPPRRMFTSRKKSLSQAEPYLLHLAAQRLGVKLPERRGARQPDDAQTTTYRGDDDDDESLTADSF